MILKMKHHNYEIVRKIYAELKWNNFLIIESDHNRKYTVVQEAKTHFKI